jgi:glycosyltransferase involved in cell wall biosynthesis
MPFGFARHKVVEADVSVLIPLYNHERYIGDALDSVLGQSVRPREIICIDDGSSDGSARVVEQFASRESLIAFKSRPNRGANRTINECIQAAQGRYVAILNSDDLFHPARLAHCIAALEADPGVAVVATDISFLDDNGRKIANPWYEAACAFYREVGDLGLALVNGNFLMTTSNIVAHRSVFETIGDFDDLRYAHDLDFFLRLVAQGQRLTIVRQPLLKYRLHTTNTISEAPSKVKVEWAAAVAFFARRIAVGPDSARRGTRYLERLLRVTDRHQLTRLIALVLLHARAADAGSPGACLADDVFLAELQEAAAR